MANAKNKRKPEIVEAPFPGRDEMNLTEYPIAVTGDRAPKGTKTLIYKDKQGQLTVTGSDAYGLPTALDTDVIVGLIQLTKQKNDFQEATVNFTRYELLRLLGWANEGKSYRRLDESLNRWAGVTLYYDRCWWDNRSKQYGDAKLHILESVIILDGTVKQDEDGSQQAFPLSSFTWNKVFMESFKAGNLKNLDTELYFSLKLATSKQLYRFLDKRFWKNRPVWTFDLNELAFDRVGLSRNYSPNAGKIKEKLDPALKELESREFLKPMSRDERYFKDGKVWKIRLIQKSTAAIELPDTVPAVEVTLPPLAAALVTRGVTDFKALELVQQHQADAIEAKLDVFDWLVGKGDKRVAKSPAGYLVKSITDDYAKPKGFISKADLEKQAETKRDASQQTQTESRRKHEADAAEKAIRQEILTRRKHLNKDDLAQLEAQAIAGATDELRQSVDSTTEPVIRRILISSITDDYLRRLIEAEKLPEPA